MDKSDNVGMLSSSLAAIIRQSLDSTFRKECFLLLGVSNHMEAQDAIYCLLKSRDVQKESNLTHLTAEGTSSQVIKPEESDQPQEKIESPILMDTQQISIKSDLPNERSNLEPYDLPIIKANELSAEESSRVEDISDDETQLDWETNG